MGISRELLRLRLFVMHPLLFLHAVPGFDDGTFKIKS